MSQVAAGVLGALLESLPLAILIVDADSRVLARNRAAEEVLAGGPGLSVGEDGRLQAARPALAKALYDAVARTCAGADPAAVSTLPSGNGAARVALVRLDSPSVPLAAIVAQRPGAESVGPDAELLRHVYGLTAAESTLAARLFRGESVRRACDVLGIGLPTARTHLSRVFAKTGARTQGDLIRIVLTGPALLARRARPEARPAPNGRAPADPRRSE